MNVDQKVSKNIFNENTFLASSLYDMSFDTSFIVGKYDCDVRR